MSGHPDDDEEQPPALREQGIIAFDVHNTATAGAVASRWLAAGVGRLGCAAGAAAAG